MTTKTMTTTERSGLMNRSILFVIALVSGGLAACGGGGKEASPKETATQEEADPQTEEPLQAGVFTSPLYGYSLEPPEGWSLHEATNELSPGQLPMVGSPEVDLFSAPGEEWIVAAAQPGISVAGLPLTLKNWTTQAIQMVQPDGCTPASTEPLELDGEPARLIVYELCAGNFMLWVVSLHRDSAYHVTWANEPGTEAADRKRFEEVLSSFTFTS
jgi:hypothetical protein